MKKVICIALAAVMALGLCACGGSNGLTGKVATDGSTSMQKVIMSLKETFEGENSGVEVTYNGQHLPEKVRRFYTQITKWRGGDKSQHWRSPNTSPTAKSLQSCPTLCDPIDSSPPGFPVLGFSRQEHWSGLPFPSPVHESEK